MLPRVVFSERAYAAILAETSEKISTETGGVFLGIIQGDTWYVIEAIDPGPKSIFQQAYFEYDRGYINHLANKINKLYSNDLIILGLWHRHPGSLDSFSGTDDGTNRQFAEGNEAGITISAIVNIDPRFRMTMYVAGGSPIRYKQIEYRIDDSEVKNAGIRFTSPKKIEEQINSYTPQRRNEQHGFGEQWQQPVINRREVSPQKLLNALVETIKTQPSSPDSWGNLANNEQGFDEIVSRLYDTIEFCSGKGLPVTVEKGKGGAVNLVFGTKPIVATLSFFYLDFSDATFVTIEKGLLWDSKRKKSVTGLNICFVFEKRLYLYDDEMFKNALAQY